MVKHILILAITFLVGGCEEFKSTRLNTPAFTTDEIKTATANDKVDRFKLAQLGQMARDQYLLDTMTGRIWRAECRTRGKTTIDCVEIVWAAEQGEDLRVQH